MRKKKQSFYILRQRLQNASNISEQNQQKSPNFNKKYKYCPMEDRSCLVDSVQIRFLPFSSRERIQGPAQEMTIFSTRTINSHFGRDKCLLRKTTAHCILFHTTRLPSSKLVVYLSVQKSRAAANVVGAYVWQKKIKFQEKKNNKIIIKSFQVQKTSTRPACT